MKGLGFDDQYFISDDSRINNITSTSRRVVSPATRSPTRFTALRLQRLALELGLVILLFALVGFGST